MSSEVVQPDYASAELAANIRTAETALSTFRARQSALQADLQAFEGRRLTPAESAKVDDLKEALEQIDRGISPAEGASRLLTELVSGPAVRQLYLARPGIQSLERELVALRRRLGEREAANARTSGGTKPYRYTGTFGKCSIGGVNLRPGDIAQLTSRQAEAFSDRFEPFDAAQPESEAAEAERLRAENEALRAQTQTSA